MDAIIQVEYHPFGQVRNAGDQPPGSGHVIPAYPGDGVIPFVVPGMRGGVIALCFQCCKGGNGPVHAKRVQDALLHIFSPALAGDYFDDFPGGDEHQVGVPVSGPEPEGLGHVLIAFDEFPGGKL